MDIPESFRDIPGNIPRLARAFKALTNIRIPQGVSVEKKKNSGSYVETGISVRLAGISSGYPSVRQGNAVSLPFFP